MGGHEELAQGLSKLQVTKKPLSFVDDLSTKINSIYVQSSSVSSSSVTCEGSKSEDDAIKFRKAGIASAQEGEDAEALISYAKSLASAPKYSRQLYETYCERSLLMLKLKRYEECILDVNRALSDQNCPKEMKKKLLDRRKECFDRDRETTGRSMEDLIITLVKRFTEERSTWTKFSQLKPNSVSSKIEFGELAYDECDWPTLVRATKDIEPGEIVLAEELYCALLAPDQCFTHCAYCLVKCDCLIPCPSCTQTMYCSEKCHNRADDAYHQTDCKMMNFYSRENHDWREGLLVRMFLRVTRQGRLLPKLMKQLKSSNIFKGKNGYSPCYERSVIDHLVIVNRCFQLFDQKLIMEIIEGTLHSIVDIILVLRNLSFFPGNTELLPDRFSEIELYAALLMASHAIHLEREFRIPLKEKPYIDDKKINLLAVSVHILQAHLCMSCNPNTQMIIENRQCVLYATRPIKAGQGLFYSNLMISWFANKSRNVRPPMCKCEACMKNWPGGEVLQKLRIRPLKKIKNDEPLWKKLDATLKAATKKFSSKSNLLDQLDQLDQLTESEILRIIINLIKFVYNNVETKPSCELVFCEEMLCEAMEVFCSDLYSRELKPLFIDRMKQFLSELRKRFINYAGNKSTSTDA